MFSFSIHTAIRSNRMRTCGCARLSNDIHIYVTWKKKHQALCKNPSPAKFVFKSHIGVRSHIRKVITWVPVHTLEYVRIGLERPRIDKIQVPAAFFTSTVQTSSVGIVLPMGDSFSLHSPSICVTVFTQETTSEVQVQPENVKFWQRLKIFSSCT